MKVCIFGTGDISSVFIEAVKKNRSIEIVGVYNRNINTAKQFSIEYNIKNYYDSVEKCLSSDCELAYIALPNSLHFPIAMQSLRAKKHVIIEKPITSNLIELNNLVICSKENNVMLFEANRVFYNQNLGSLKNMLNDVAPIRLVQMNYCKISRKYNQYLEGKKPNVFSLEYSGGALYDLGVYGVHLAISLFGSPNRTKYTCVKLDTGVDGSGTIIMEYNKFIVNINISKISDGHNFVEIQGEAGTIISNSAPSVLSDIKLIRNNEVIELINKVVEKPFNNFVDMCISIINKNNNSEYLALLNQSINVMKVLEECRKSASIIFKDDPVTSTI